MNAPLEELLSLSTSIERHRKLLVELSEKLPDMQGLPKHLYVDPQSRSIADKPVKNVRSMPYVRQDMVSSHVVAMGEVLKRLEAERARLQAENENLRAGTIQVRSANDEGVYL